MLSPAARTGSGRRLYDAACLARLELIVTLRLRRAVLAVVVLAVVVTWAAGRR